MNPLTRMQLSTDEQLIQAHLRRQRQRQLEDLLASSSSVSAASTSLRNPYSTGAAPHLLQAPCTVVPVSNQALRLQHLQSIAVAAPLVHSVPGLAGGLLVSAPPAPYFPRAAMEATLAVSQPRRSFPSSAPPSVDAVAQQETTQPAAKQDSFSRNQKLDTAPDVFEPFPTKLYRIIQDAEDNNMQDTISFLPHGRAFVISQPRLFVMKIMPKYFTTSRMASFQRQLNLYGFKRITVGNDVGGYCHEFFVKGHPGLLRRIRRKRYDNNKKKYEPRLANSMDNNTTTTSVASMPLAGGNEHMAETSK